MYIRCHRALRAAASGKSRLLDLDDTGAEKGGSGQLRRVSELATRALDQGSDGQTLGEADIKRQRGIEGVGTIGAGDIGDGHGQRQVLAG